MTVKLWKACGLALIAIAAIAIAAVAAGCGSSGGAGSTTTSRLHAQAPGVIAALPADVAAKLARLPRLPVPANSPLPRSPSARIERAYVTALFDDAQSVWRHEFTAARERYVSARLVIFSNVIRSKCGPHEDSGPFYCPVNHGVYVDLGFFSQLLRDSQVGAAAQGYLLGHEFAHHVQRLIGIAQLVDAANHANPSGDKGRSVQVELEADCLAGVWARSAYPRSGLKASELADAVKTADMLGDDYLQEAAGRIVDTTLFTHGSSQQRQQWLKIGYHTGEASACNTFQRG